MKPDDPPEERVVYRERFQGAHLDFEGKSIFTRYDRCEFVKCTLLIDRATEQLAFTAPKSCSAGIRYRIVFTVYGSR
jgi:hypothetical protein